MASESTVQRKIWLGLGAISRLFRLNTGRAWLSNMGPAGVQKLADGAVLIKSARSIAIGFAAPSGDPVEGASDLNGWTTVEVTPEMVGKRVAIYTAIETKATKGGRKREGQINFCEQVDAAGGIAGFANSEEAARGILESWFKKTGAKKINARY
ncbi:hypothetical protein [Klebsiella pneumoniae]|uniref:hypothetical protein n=1 Tax=Klebsiella pneumoniae TaxID=573 RepID=UPI0034D31FC9